MTALTNEADSCWNRLRAATPARIGLARSGSSIATRELLAFRLAHAEARDAVGESLDSESILRGVAERNLQALTLHSAASDRCTYLARPDLGRSLEENSRIRLRAIARKYDLVFILADGLSARAVHRHALPLLDQALPQLNRHQWHVGPVIVVHQGRVAIGDEIGQELEAALVAVLIGERPGLTSPDSLGIYLTWNPVIGRTDAERNCLSNIRPEGLTYPKAAQRLLHLCAEARQRQCTGITLKDETALIESTLQAISRPSYTHRSQ
jgi:ethanolamine ammonia-lyase small subunit